MRNCRIMDNLAVVTTRFIIDDNSPIVSVFKDDEGEWQFYGKEENILEEDAQVISLEEVLKLDKVSKRLFQ